MKKQHIYTKGILAAALLVAMLAMPLKAQIVMRSQVIGSGASAMTNGTTALVGTVGQAVIGPTGGTLKAGQGFWYTIPTGVSAVREERTGNSGALQLSQNYPNPFSGSTKMNITLPSSGDISLKLYDGLGREVQTLMEGRREAGTFTVTVTSENLSSGRYTAVLMMNGQRRSVVMSLVK